jgi:hypothetical protein
MKVTLEVTQSDLNLLKLHIKAEQIFIYLQMMKKILDNKVFQRGLLLQKHPKVKVILFVKTMLHKTTILKIFIV